jgi:hypothetical protein
MYEFCNNSFSVATNDHLAAFRLAMTLIASLKKDGFEIEHIVAANDGLSLMEDYQFSEMRLFLSLI